MDDTATELAGTNTDNHRGHRAALELLDEWAEDARHFAPLTWTMDPDGHLHGRPTSGPQGERLAVLTVWANYLGIDLKPQAGGEGVHGMRRYTPDGATGVGIKVVLST